MKKINKRGVLGSTLYISLNYPHKIICTLMEHIFSKLKVDKKMIVFSSTPDYSDNSKALYDYYRKNFSDYKYIWLIETESINELKKRDKNTKFIRATRPFYNHQTLRALYYCYRAKVIYYTHYPIKLKNKRSQFIVNLWHGCGFKDNEKKKNKDLGFDIALVPGELFIETKSRFWNCSKDKIIPIGYPRYDLLLHKKKSIYKTNLTNVIWMPTFRKTTNMNFPEDDIEQKYDLPILKNNQELKNLNEFCRKNYISLIIKRHPFQKIYQAENLQLSNIKLVSNDDIKKEGEELYSVLANMDGLITDYSSVSFDYLLLDRPIGYVLDDYQQYSDKRGFIFENPKDYMAGNYIYNYNDLVKFLKNVKNGKDYYKEARRKVRKLAHNPTNSYCKRIKEYVDMQLEKKGENE